MWMGERRALFSLTQKLKISGEGGGIKERRGGKVAAVPHHRVGFT